MGRLQKQTYVRFWSNVYAKSRSSVLGRYFALLPRPFRDPPTPLLCYNLSYEDIVIIGGSGARPAASRWQRPPDQLGCLPDWCGKLVRALVCRRFGHVELPF